MNLHLVVEGETYELGLEPTGEDGHYHATVDAEPFDVAVEATDDGITCRIGDTTYQVQRKGRVLFVDGERVDVAVSQLAQAGLRGGHAAGGEITPPMPGRIVEILVEQGDEVEQGDPLLVLEAMKMQNEIDAPGAATVKRIHVAKGDTVEAGDVLLELDPI